MIHFRFVIVVFDIFEETSNQIVDGKTCKASMQCKTVFFSVSIKKVVELKCLCMPLRPLKIYTMQVKTEIKKNLYDSLNVSVLN